ncbi:hypothetical protein [Rubritalea tangerina]|uniref:hypothetical protein n=1 Tax=Rubritalea tangerina TaxID=430798 RepID=UPI00361E7A3C
MPEGDWFGVAHEFAGERRILAGNGISSSVVCEIFGFYDFLVVRFRVEHGACRMIL